jgi:hypothetical protein
MTRTTKAVVRASGSWAFSQMLVFRVLRISSYSLKPSTQIGRRRRRLRRNLRGNLYGFT